MARGLSSAGLAEERKNEKKKKNKPESKGGYKAWKTYPSVEF